MTTGKRPSDPPGRKKAASSGASGKEKPARARGRLPGIGDRADEAYAQEKRGGAARPKGKTDGPRKGAGLPAQQEAMRKGTLGRKATAAGKKGPSADWFEPPVAKSRKRKPAEEAPPAPPPARPAPAARAKAAPAKAAAAPAGKTRAQAAPEKPAKARASRAAAAPQEVPPAAAPARSRTRRDGKGAQLDARSPLARRLVDAMAGAGKNARDLTQARPVDVEDMTDDEIFRIVMLELYAARKRKDDVLDIGPLQEALFDFDVRAVYEQRDEAQKRLMRVVGDPKKVQAMLQNVLRFVSIQDRFGSFRHYLLDKVDRFENLAFALEHQFVGFKESQIHSQLEALGLSRRMAAQVPVLRLLKQWGALDDAAPTPANWAAARDVLRSLQTEVGCSMGALEQMFLVLARYSPELVATG